MLSKTKLGISVPIHIWNIIFDLTVRTSHCSAARGAVRDGGEGQPAGPFWPLHTWSGRLPKTIKVDID
jgi:hypothetical protein